MLVAVTGASGAVGSFLREELDGAYDFRLIDRKRVRNPGSGEKFVRADVRSLRSMRHALRDVDAVVHLAGIAGETAIERILDANVRGTYNVLEAARQNGVRRVILASTGHVTGFYPRSQMVAETDPYRPDSVYAVSKIACEALGRLYADKHGMQLFCIRIGRACREPQGEADRAIWCSPRDLARLVRIGLELPNLQYEIVYGVSNNPARWWSPQTASRLGYHPQDDASAFTFNVTPRCDVGALVQGAEFAARDYTIPTRLSPLRAPVLPARAAPKRQD